MLAREMAVVSRKVSRWPTPFPSSLNPPIP